MPTNSPNEGLQGQASGEIVQAPGKANAQVAPQSPSLARRARNIAGKVGLIAGIALAANGCDYFDNDKDTTETAPAASAEPSSVPVVEAGATCNLDKACATMREKDSLDGSEKAKMGYHTTGTVSIHNEDAYVFLPCLGRTFVNPKIEVDGDDVTFTVETEILDKGTFKKQKVRITGRMRKPEAGYNRIGTAPSAREIFGEYLDGCTIDVNGSKKPLGGTALHMWIQPLDGKATPAPATPKVTPKTKKVAEQKDYGNAIARNRRDIDTNSARLNAVEAELAAEVNRGKGRDARLDQHTVALGILIQAAQRPAGNPHPTPADVTNSALNVATE